MKVCSQDLNIVALFKQGLHEHDAGNLKAAKKVYREILALQPNHCEANHNIGVVFVSENKFYKALDFFKLALNASPNVSLFWASYINTLVKLEKIIEAKALIKAAKNSGISCENILAISRRLNIENQEPRSKDTQKLEELISQKKFDEATTACFDLMGAYPRSAVLHITLGKCYFELDKIELSIRYYTKATIYQPHSEVSFAMLSRLYSSQGNTTQAIENLKIAVVLKPNAHEFNVLLGLELIKKGDVDQAIIYLKKALLQDPKSSSILSALGTAFKMNGDLERAITHYKHAIKLDPQDPVSFFNIGNTFKEAGCLEAAIESYKQTLKIKPDYAQAHYAMGNALKEHIDLDAAINSYNQAIKINPNYLDAHNNKGNALRDKGDIVASIKSYNQALDINPDDSEVLLNRSIAHLTQGDFKNGWIQYDRRLEQDSVKDTHSISNKPEWKPTDSGRVLLWGEQGIGDQVMYASMISELHANLDQLIIQVDERLIPLFKRSFPKDIIYYSNESFVSKGFYDYSIPFGSLPMHFRTDLKSFKKTSGSYLKSDKLLSTKLREKLITNDNHYLVGISWMGGSQKDSAHIKNSKNKSLKLAQISQILTTKNVKLVNLQYGDTDHECSQLIINDKINIHNVSEIDKFNDIDGLTALIDACDHIISIDNVTAHLAGALGKKTSILLPFSSDWKWGQGKEYSYWHSSLKLFRQEKILDWSTPLKNLKMEFNAISINPISNNANQDQKRPSV